MLRRKRREPPGTLHTDETEPPPALHVFVYNRDDLFADGPFSDIGSALSETTPSGAVRWINIDGVHDGALLRTVGRELEVPHLLLEDIQNTGHRPKLDEFDTGVLIIAKMVRVTDEDSDILAEQVSLLLVGSTVVTFQENPGDVFEPIRHRIRTGHGLVRMMSADYLINALLDLIGDATFDAIEDTQEAIEEVEDAIVAGHAENVSNAVFGLHHQAVELRRGIWPLREVTQHMIENGFSAISPRVRPYAMDVHEHVVALVELADALREQAGSLVHFHAASIAAQQNQVMKTLTVIATIFIPLTFVTGLYGMNFVFMPELQWRYGYFTVLGVMAVIGVGMVWWFRRRRWW